MEERNTGGASGPAGWWDVAKRSWAEAGEDNLGLIAAGVAFYAFLAFVPMLSAVVLSYGLVASAEQVAKHISALAETMPQDAAEIIGSQLENIVETSSSSIGLGLAVALGLALYGAMKGAGAIITALNIVYGIEERRSWLGQTLTAIAITAGLVLIFIFGSLAISIVNFIGSLLPERGGALQLALQIAFWIATAVMVSLVIAIIYRYAPNRPGAKWRWITPGSAIATAVWIAATVGFSFYVSNFTNYNATYGSLGAVIVFLTWLYLSAYILLLGGELNQVIERRRAADGSPAEPSAEARRDAAEPTCEAQATPSFAGVVARIGALGLLLSLLPKRRRDPAAPRTAAEGLGEG